MKSIEMKGKDTLLKFLEITANTRDSEVFLKNFRSQSPEKFAIIYIDEGALTESFLTFYYDLNFLYNLNLYPTVVIEKTSEDYLKIFFKNIYEKFKSSENFFLFPIDIFYSENNTLDEIVKCISSKRIPVLVFDENKISTLEYLKTIANNLFVNKLIFLRERAGLKKKNSNKIISLINLETDYDPIIEQNSLDEFDKKLLDNSKFLLEKSKNSRLAIAITSPALLLKELFTIKGNGTFIKKGSKIQFFEDYKKINEMKLKSLIENAFQKKIQDKFFKKEILGILIESDYRGAAIFQNTEFGILLSKFAVDEIARGEGIGREIWDKMKIKFQTIFWRANPNNPINSWYQKECDGFQKFQNWNIYWIGLQVTQIPEICKFMLALEADFSE
ncbi:MAG: acetylglutamate kinase [Leptospiraceae bacterium]|nr:acetylglutamate kinase [Leptospiraceae bacterium]MCK6380560.1 acetylglutamate kinase [Leptospiraceae bacterium]NUM40731.1 acetylglutamate kinase [Leptospiraceae bacterium]